MCPLRCRSVRSASQSGLWQNCEQVGLSVDSKAQKTKGLLGDLRVTMESLDARIEALRKSIKAMRRGTVSLQQRIEKLDTRKNTEKGNLCELLAKRSEIEKRLAFYEQVRTFEDMIRWIADETESEVVAAVAGLSLTVVRELSAKSCHPGGFILRQDWLTKHHQS